MNLDNFPVTLLTFFVKQGIKEEEILSKDR